MTPRKIKLIQKIQNARKIAESFCNERDISLKYLFSHVGSRTSMEISSLRRELILTIKAETNLSPESLSTIFPINPTTIRHYIEQGEGTFEYTPKNLGGGYNRFIEKRRLEALEL